MDSSGLQRPQGYHPHHHHHYLTPFSEHPCQISMTVAKALAEFFRALRMGREFEGDLAREGPTMQRPDDSGVAGRRAPQERGVVDDLAADVAVAPALRREPGLEHEAREARLVVAREEDVGGRGLGVEEREHARLGSRGVRNCQL